MSLFFPKTNKKSIDETKVLCYNRMKSKYEEDECNENQDS